MMTGGAMKGGMMKEGRCEIVVSKGMMIDGQCKVINSGYAYDRRDGYYDPEIVGRNNQRGNGKRSVWDNLRDAFNI